jgi:hypothetical protein
VDRVLKNTAATLSVTFYSDETPTEATGSVLVTITDETGAAIVTAQAATNDPAVGLYTYTLPAQSTVKKLTATWTGVVAGVSQTLTTRVEVVGARLFSYVDLRAFDASLTAARFPTAKVEQARVQVEDEFEELTGLGFIPRWGRTTTVGGGGVALRRLDHYQVNAILRATVAGVPLSGGELAALRIDQDKLRRIGPTLSRAAGVWTELAAVQVDYEYGITEPDQAVRDAAMLRARTRLTADRSGVDSRATSFDTPEGSTYDLSRATIDLTGVPEVDAVLARYLTGDALELAERVRGLRTAGTA